jgi:hypothetical protein
MKKQKEIQKKHQEFLKLFNPLLDFMKKNGFSYFVVAGKDGICARYIEGNPYDLSAMIGELAEKNKQVKEIFEYGIKSLETDKTEDSK